MSLGHETPNSSKDGEESDYNVKSSPITYENYVFHDVSKDLGTWKKENTCHNCWITFENFQVLLSHNCKPHRCEACSTAFEHDFMLNMHQCNSIQSGRSSHKLHFCTICNSSFPEKSALLKHQTFCIKKTHCVHCEKKLPIKSTCDFCRKCRFILQKDQKYSLRCKSSSKLPVAESGVKENGNGFHSLINHKVNGDRKVSEPENVDDYSSSGFSELKRKRRSLDSIAENSSKKKTFESNATDSLSNSDTSRDTLDNTCSIKNRKRKKDIENLTKSLVTVLGNSSEKKMSDQSSVSKKDLVQKISKASVVDASCNGIKDSKPKRIKRYDSDSDLFGNDKSFTLSSTRLKRNFKEDNLDISSKPCDQKACKETENSKEHRSEVNSLEKIDQVLLQPLRKSKRNLNNRKSASDPPSVEKNETEKPEEYKTASVESSEPVTESNKNNEFSGKNDHIKESIESSCVVNSNKDEKTASKSSVGTSKEVAVKKSPRLNPVKNLPSSSNGKSPELKERINSSESVHSSVRKSKRINRDESAKRSDSSGSDMPVQKNDKSCSFVEKEVPYSAPVSPRSSRNVKHKKDPEISKDESSVQGNAEANDSDAASSASTSSIKPKRNSLRKNFDELSLHSPALGHDSNAHADKDGSSDKTPVLTSKNKMVNRSNKNGTAEDLADTASNQEKNKVDKAQDDERAATETSAMSKAVKCKNKNNEKAQKEALQSKKLISKNESAKRPKTPENPSPSTRKGSFSSAKQNSSGVKSNSRSKINTSVRTSQSSIDYTPGLEVTESSLNSVPDSVSFSTLSPSRSSFYNKSLASKGKVSSSENDTIKLQDLLNVLPDGDSGVLLRVLSITSDNYRCLKCNKLFKTIKMASTHYANCKNNRVKRTTSLLLKDIIWICVQCNYYCYQMSKLNFHRQSCSKSSSCESIDNYIRNYNNTCLNICSKCSYSCISSITFKKHTCEQRIEQMSNCIIGVEKLEVKDLSSQKYECTYCESTFLDLKAYERHIAKHTVSADERPQAIKKEPVETSEDAIKNFLYTSMQEENSTQKNRMEIGKILSFLQKEGDGPVPFDLPDSENQLPSKVWRKYLQDYTCRCNKHKQAVEEKPCLACLNTYIKKKGSFHTDCSTQTDLPYFEDATLSETTSMTDISTLNLAASGMTFCSSALGFADTVSMSSSMDASELPPIHIQSVSSCNNPGLSIPSTSADSGHITDMPSDLISSLPPNLEADEFSPHVSPDSSRKSGLYISLILILKGNFVDSKYTIEKHNNLVKSIYKLKFDKLAEPHQVHPDQYYLLTEYIHRSGDESSNHLPENMSHAFDLGPSKLAYNESVLQNYFLIDRPFAELLPLFFAQEPCDFDVVLCDGNRHFIHLSWQFAQDIGYSAYCVKCDSEPTGIQLICGYCLSTINIHLLIEHFDEDHEGAYTYNILIL